MAGRARPTLRCLREDLGQAVPPADTPLDDVPHPLLAKASERFADDATPHERITSIDDQVLFKVKVQRWRGAVWTADDGIPWLVAAGQRAEGSPDDFYASLTARGKAARSQYNAVHTPPLTTETYTGGLLPEREDELRWKAEHAVRVERRLRVTVHSLLRESLLDGHEHAAARSAAGRIAASYLGRLSATRSQASASTANVTVGTGISCASTTACLAVGVHLVSTSSSQTITPFAARLHAGTWKSVPVKTPKGSLFTILDGVSCKAATYCLAVGETASNSAAGFASYVLTWNGTTLTPVTAPPMPAHTFGLVTSVSCVAVNRCVVIGFGVGEATGVSSTIIWTWNGTKWARTTVPDADPSTTTEYTRLHCFSLTSCVVAGDSIVTTSSSGTDTPVVAAWNGTTFTDLKAPLPAGVSQPLFSGLSCASAHGCAVVGTGYTTSTGTNSIAFAEVWNGKTWTVTKWSGPKGTTDAELRGVSCTSAVRCMAVGVHGTATAAAPAALAWNGVRWTVLKVAGPGTGKAAAFADVSCPVNGKCVTTGAVGKANGSTGAPIAGYWNGSTWKYGLMLPAAAA